MKTPKTQTVDALHRAFHEPQRLAIVSTLAAEGEPLTFTQLKDSCGLTDGNLNGHLSVLVEEKIARTQKSTSRGRPVTRVSLTANGRRQFVAYLDALESVLLQARTAIGTQARAATEGTPALVPGALATTHE